MPRPRKNDPSNLPDQPRLVTDPARIDLLIRRFMQRRAAIRDSYWFAWQFRSGRASRNESLNHLKSAVAGKGKLREKVRLDFELEVLVNYHAKQHARLERNSSSVCEDDVLYAGERRCQK